MSEQRRPLAMMRVMVLVLAVVAAPAALAQQASTTGATVTGHVTDARAMPVSNYSVVVFPTDRGKWVTNLRFVRLTRPAQDGSFEVNGLPPGEYWLAAVDTIDGDEESGEWQKADVLEQLSFRAHRVTLVERQRYMTILRLIRR
jgi:hypothetical protein